MFLKNSIAKSTTTYSQSIKELKKAIDSADAIIIGAGAGLSTSAGFTYDGERFKNNFADFIDKYHFTDMYSGGFYKFQTPEEYWAYWSRYIYINRYCDIPNNTYSKLLELVKDKEYFVITTNVDHCFQKAGFDKNRLFYTQGDYGLFQCSIPCCNETFDNEEHIKQMVKQQRNMKIPSELAPKCPHCNAPLTMNLRADDKFVEDEGWHQAAERYNLFISKYENLKVLYLELGVGYNTPVIIKYPFWQMTAKNRQATYACINLGESICPDEIKEQSIMLDCDINYVLTNIQLL